jgi:hypothetical protein
MASYCPACSTEEKDFSKQHVHRAAPKQTEESTPPSGVDALERWLNAPAKLVNVGLRARVG